MPDRGSDREKPKGLKKSVLVHRSATELAKGKVECAEMDSKNACFDDPWDNGGKVFGE